MMQDDDDDDDDENDDPMILNNRVKNHTSERTIVPWTVIFVIVVVVLLLLLPTDLHSGHTYLSFLRDKKDIFFNSDTNYGSFAILTMFYLICSPLALFSDYVEILFDFL